MKLSQVHSKISEENPKDIKEIEKDDLDSLKCNKKIIEKENKKKLN